MAVTAQMKPKFDSKILVHVGITFIFMFFFQFVPAPEPVTRYGMLTVGIFIGLIYGWTVSPGNMVWPALMGLVSLGISDFGSCSQVMIKAFGSDTIVLNIMIMMMIGALNEAGLSEWLIVKLVTAKFAQNRPWVLTSLLVAGPFVLAIFINAMILAIFLLSLYGTVFKQAGYKHGDKYVVMTTLGMMLSLLLAPLIFPFKGSALMFLPVITAGSGIIFDHAKYMLTVIPFCALTTLLYIPLMKIMRCDPSKIVTADLSELEAKYKYGLNIHQKAILFFTVLFVVGAIIISFASGPEGIRLLLKKFGVYGWAMLTCGMMMVIRLDSRALVDPAVVGKHVSWNILFVIASATTISGVMTSEATGVSSFLSQLVSPIMANLSPIVFLIVVALVTFIATNVFNNLATVYTMIAVSCALFSNGLDFNMEIAGVLIACLGLVGFWLPASSVYGALLYTQEYMPPTKLYFYGAITMVFIIVCVLVIYLPLALFVYQ